MHHIDGVWNSVAFFDQYYSAEGFSRRRGKFEDLEIWKCEEFKLAQRMKSNLLL